MTRFVALYCCLLLFAFNLQASDKPNVVLILSDDHCWTDYSFMGSPIAKTPNIDRLAAEGVTFTRGYVPTALCRASLMIFATGLYAHQHRTAGNDPNQVADKNEYHHQRERLISHIDTLPTLPAMLGKIGYRSLQTGKWWEGNFKRGGFDEGMTSGFPNPGGRHGDVGLDIGRKTMAPIEQFVKENRDLPFFIWYAPMLPHDPHNPPKDILDKYLKPGRPVRIARYYAMVEWFDNTIGQLLRCLQENNVLDNTLIVYAADNGWAALTEENTPATPWTKDFEPRSKSSPYDKGTRTPIIIRWPKRFKAHRDDLTLVSTIDIVRTILSITGAKRPETLPDLALPGLDLSDFCEHGTPLLRKIVFGECFAHDMVDIDDPIRSRLYRWCIEGRWKLLLSDSGDPGTKPYVKYDTSQPQLFDLLADPMEENDLSAQHPDIVGRLQNEIDQWSACPPPPTDRPTL